MGAFFSFLAVAFFLTLSVSKKIAEQRRAEEARRAKPITRPEDLPEATRRMLYGESGVPPRKGQAPGYDIPTARRRQQGAQQVPPAMPAQQVQPPVEAPRPMVINQDPTQPRRRPVQPPVVFAPPPLTVAQEEALSPSERERVDEVRYRIQQQLEMRRREAEAAQRREAQQVHTKRVQSPPNVPQPKRAQQPKPELVDTTTPQGPAGGMPEYHEDAVVKRPCPTSNAAMRRILYNSRSFRQAILLTEILSPPISMR